jgi:hypothetical protein
MIQSSETKPTWQVLDGEVDGHWASYFRPATSVCDQIFDDSWVSLKSANEVLAA